MPLVTGVYAGSWDIARLANDYCVMLGKKNRKMNELIAGKAKKEITEVLGVE